MHQGRRWFRPLRAVRHAGEQLMQRARSLRPLITKLVGMCGVTDEDLKSTLGATLTGLLWGALALSALGTFGVDIKPLLGLSTLLGFALSISAKNILSNMFSAAYVLWVRPFRRGDVITVMEFGKSDTYTGQVLAVDYHFVRLRTDDNKEIMIPSHAVYGKVVKLVSASGGT
jgi:small-conductance mechanosensitive channel